MKKTFEKITILPMIILILTNCELAKKPQENSTHGVVIGYFYSEQSAVDSRYTFDSGRPLRDFFSNFYGRVAVASLNSTFEKAFLPKMGCYKFENAPEATFEMTKPLDPGSIAVISESGEGFQLPKYNGPLFFAQGFVSPGRYRLQSTGINGALAFDEEFQVPQSGSAIKVSSGSNLDQGLPTPLIDPSISVRFDRSSGATVSFTAPADADFVKIYLGEIYTRGADIICYGPKDSPIVIPSELFADFPASDGGSFELSFVNTYLNKGVARYNETFIHSSIKHVHGAQIIDRDQPPLDFGKVIFE